MLSLKLFVKVKPDSFDGVICKFRITYTIFLCRIFRLHFANWRLFTVCPLTHILVPSEPFVAILFPFQTFYCNITIWDK